MANLPLPRSVFFLLVSGLFFSFSGCSNPSSNPPGSLDPQAEQRFQEHRRDAAQFAPSSTPKGAIDVQSYRLKGRFDWKQRKFIGLVQIELIALNDLQVVELDNHTDVKAIGEGGRPLPFEIAPKTLRIKRPMKKGSLVTLSIGYEAWANRLPNGEAASLVAVAPRAGDPVPARTVSTFSEPLGAAEWMPVHNRPSDRALFSAEMVMETSERLISNGDLVMDQVADSKRTMRYETRYTLPVYLMAYSIGEFTISTRYHGALPISIWARRGLPVDFEGVLQAIESQMTKFEKLLIPYPFEKYALVLLPEFTGGIEHAGITFQGETSSSQGKLVRDHGLTAHELAHQWFGDLVTISTWDDLWVKEGMATLLAEEASRDFEDRTKSGRLFGESFNVGNGEAVRDLSLHAEQKYTSGPYGRGAWIYTQLRSVLGETRFWGILRQMLTEKRFSSISTEEMITRFSTALSPEQTAVLRAAIDAKPLPRVSVSREGEKTKFAVIDPHGTLLAPIEILRYAPKATTPTKTSLIGAGEILLDSLASDDHLLVINSRETHPLTDLLDSEDMFKHLISPRLAPRDEAAEKVVHSLGGYVEWLALYDIAAWKLSPARFVETYSKLGAEGARYFAIRNACEQAADAAWKPILSDAILVPPYLGLPEQGGSRELSICRRTIGDELLRSRFKQVAKDPSNPTWSEAELYSLSLISSDPATAYPFATGLAMHGPSNRAKRLGIMLMTRHLTGSGGYTAPSDADRPKWLEMLRTLVSTYDSQETLGAALATIEVASDKGAGPALASVVSRKGSWRLHKRAICTAYQVTKGDAKAWSSFVAGIADIKSLSAHLQQLVQTPEKCEI